MDNDLNRGRLPESSVGRILPKLEEAKCILKGRCRTRPPSNIGSSFHGEGEEEAEGEAHEGEGEEDLGEEDLGEEDLGDEDLGEEDDGEDLEEEGEDGDFDLDEEEEDWDGDY